METVIRSYRPAYSGEIYKAIHDYYHYRSGNCNYTQSSVTPTGCALRIRPSVNSNTFKFTLVYSVTLFCDDSGGTCHGEIYVNIGTYSVSAEIPNDLICGDVFSHEFGDRLNGQLSFTDSALLSGAGLNYEFKSLTCTESGIADVYGFYTDSAHSTLSVRVVTLLKKR